MGQLLLKPIVPGNNLTLRVQFVCTVVPRLTSDPANEFFG